MLTYINIYIYKIYNIYIHTHTHIYTYIWLTISSLQIRTGQQSITANLRPLTAHIYHVMIIVTCGFSKKSFFYYYFYFLEILLNDLDLVFSEFKHIYKTQRTSMFSSYLFIFYLLFRNPSVY